MTTTIHELHSIREQLLQHPVYKHMNTLDRVRIFMKHHAFAVWDFMSLLKALQNTLTCVQVPWMPNPHAEYARFINEIVLGEETDEDGSGSYTSHFELYIQAMEEIGADTEPILHYLHLLQVGADPIEALNDPIVPKTAKEFVNNSLTLALHGKQHEITAAFFFGREDLIPDMFTVLLKEMHQSGRSTDRLTYYLQRHIELDGDHHGPLAEKLLSFVCEDNPTKIEEANHIAQNALHTRIRLWDGVLAEILEKGI